MPKKKPKKTKKEKTPETPEEEPEEEPKAKKGSSVSVYDKAGKYIRTFCKERHGSDYKAKAKEFVEKVEGRKAKDGGPGKGVQEE